MKPKIRVKILLILIVALFTVGVSSFSLYQWIKFQGTTITLPPLSFPPPQKISPPEIFISSDVLNQGDVLVVKIESEAPLKNIEGSLRTEKINFFELKENQLVAIIGISIMKEAGEYDLVINSTESELFKKTIEIVAKELPIETFPMTSALKEAGYAPGNIVEDIMDKEKPFLDETFRIFTPGVYFNKPFIYPLTEIKITDDFGIIRQHGETAIQHLGTDLGAKSGTPIWAINDGVVRLTENLRIHGKTLVVDHGSGIFSLYAHLSGEFKVSEGEKVKRGDTIGLVGSTGYSTGPHLYFRVKINNQTVDPLKFIETVEKELD